MSRVSGLTNYSTVNPNHSDGLRKAKPEAKKSSPDYEVSLSKNTKNLEKNLKDASESKSYDVDPAALAQKIHAKKFGKLEKPGIFFVSGFDWFGASSVKGNYDGIRDMAEAVEGARHYAWDQQEEILGEIKKRNPDQPIILVGHSFGGDAVVEIAQQLNTIENGFRSVDLMVTLDSVGLDNDIVPQNVKQNLNFLAQGNRFINDGPNIAANYERSDVTNFLRHEEHAELDDATDIQIEILEAIQKIV
ncbi:MAG: hypothetical protein KC478_00710 [Bacteriovoracaceae bacterium]|nr:hypothetical protein [Bacteriovoracaceae bacterium]